MRQQIPPTIYEPALQNTGIGQMAFEVRVAGNPLAIISAVRGAVRELDPNLPLFEFTTQSETAEESLAQERLFVWLTSLFGLAALTLASIGLYGVMAYSVARRRREIGIRLALGAQPRRVLRMVLRETLSLAALGVALGLATALVVTRLIASLLYGLSPHDPLTIALATVLMLAVAAMAGLLPARRAAATDPTTALRYE